MRTISTKDTDKFAKAICAFANDLSNKKLPGYLLIGVCDDGSLNGLKATDELLRNLAGLRSDGNIQPKPNETDYHNPVIAVAMKTLGCVNQFGRGIEMVQEELEANKNGLPKFKFDDITTFKVS